MAWRGNRRIMEPGCARRHLDVFRANGGRKKTRGRPGGGQERTEEKARRAWAAGKGSVRIDARESPGAERGGGGGKEGPKGKQRGKGNSATGGDSVGSDRSGE
jgi:hypothetical protein